MRKLIYCILILFPVFSFSQNQEITKPHKFAVGLCFSPDYSYRYLQTDNDSLKFIKQIRDTTETADFGFTTGISLLYKLNNRFVIESGLLYSKKGYKNLKTNFTPIDPNDPILPVKLSIYYTYSYLCIPLKLNYVFLDKRLKLFVSAGVSANFFIKERTKIVNEFNNDKTSVTYNEENKAIFTKLNFELLAGLGADYDVNKHFKLRLEPLFRRSLNSITTTDIKGYLCSGGLNFGVYYKF